MDTIRRLRSKFQRLYLLRCSAKNIARFDFWPDAGIVDLIELRFVSRVELHYEEHVLQKLT